MSTGLFFLKESAEIDRYSNSNIYADELIMNNFSYSRKYFALWQARKWYSEERLEIVNPHWLQYPPPPENTLYFLAALYIFIMTAGIFGNLLVISMVVRCQSLRSPANILVTNLAISDLTMMMKMPLFIYHSIHDGIPLGKTVCKIYGFVGGLSGTVSICTLASIALDRYYVIVYPLNRTFTTLRSKICIIISWIYGGIFAGLPLFYPATGTYVPEGYLISCSYDYLTSTESVRTFILCYFFAAWVAPFLIITACYSKIIRVVIQTRNIGNKMEDPSISSRHCKEQDQKKKEVRLALVVLAIIGLWFAAWTPYAIVSLIGISGEGRFISPLASMIPALFAKSASCIDPFVYAVTNQKFKEELSNLLSKFRNNRNESTNKIWSTRMSKEPTVKCSKDSEEGIEEMTVTIDLTGKRSEQKMTPKRGIGLSSVKPAENIVEGSLSNTGKRNRASWIIRPNFSNQSSSLRNVARYWNKSKEGSIEEHISM